MYVDGEITVGSGLVGAYELESKAAIFPRVVIPLKLLDECANDKLGNSISEYVAKEDGVYITDYISHAGRIKESRTVYSELFVNNCFRCLTN